MNPAPSAANSSIAPPAAVTLTEAVPVWARIAALSFGGPAGQIAVMHRILVEERRWISENRFLHALNFCTLLPGDLIFTGTPAGIGGVHGRYLAEGDVIASSVEGIGSLENRCVAGA